MMKLTLRGFNMHHIISIVRIDGIKLLKVARYEQGLALFAVQEIGPFTEEKIAASIRYLKELLWTTRKSFLQQKLSRKN